MRSRTAVQALRLAEVRKWAASGRARAIRERAHLSLADIAVPVNVFPSTIYRWERGLREPKGEAALRYHEFLTSLNKALAA